MKLALTSGIFLCVLFSSCSTKSVREPASAPSSEVSCDDFNALPAAAKAEFIQKRELDSAASFLDTAPTPQLSTDLHAGDQATLSYVESFIGGLVHGAAYDSEAMLATTRFLVPPVEGETGYPTLKPTITRACDFLETPRMKMVHATGTFASAHMVVYPKLQALAADGSIKPGAKTRRIWTGLFNTPANQSVPLMLRFSIANPVAHTLLIGGKSLSLEFIPGLGLKFLIDGQKSIDLVAMESLAGQGADHDYFKYDFSPDFSAHAPPKFNTASSPNKDEILSRYAANPVNRKVMGWVGERFFQVLPMVYNVDLKAIDTHSPKGPNPFIISIQKMAAFDHAGNKIDQPKRPWRLVFSPALDNVAPERRAEVTNSSPRTIRDVTTDFRYKLAHLKSGDRVYYVIGETESGARYRIGEIVLDSAPIPTEFADQEFFIQHDIEMNRLDENSSSIIEP